MSRRTKKRNDVSDAVSFVYFFFLVRFSYFFFHSPCQHLQVFAACKPLIHLFFLIGALPCAVSIVTCCCERASLSRCIDRLFFSTTRRWMGAVSSRYNCASLMAVSFSSRVRCTSLLWSSNLKMQKMLEQKVLLQRSHTVW
ncbi:hypothetical protein BC940DRAFT_287005 [Gongronella butleri]|nr:hypothetical protein BC940DRAFT_287005 [Gongronella butleri]